MCENHSVDEDFWIRKLMLWVYGKWVDDTLDFYLFLGRMGRVPLLGGVVRFFAGQYGKYIHGGRAATVDECIDVLSEAGQVTLMDCACRVKYGNCDQSIRTCIGINTGAEVLGSLRKEAFVSKDKAIDIVRESYKNGLIRSITHCVTPNAYVICNCCTCCCVPYKLRNDYGIRNAIENGNSVATIDFNKCLKCQKCVEVCPEQVIDTALAKVDIDKCLGCGLCQQVCAGNAIQMVERLNRTDVLRPGLMERFLMYGVFLGVILPLAIGFKINRLLQ